MTINHFILSAYFTFITTFILGIFVLSRDPRNRIYQIFSIYSFSIALWSFAVSRFIPNLNPISAIFWGKILHLGAIMIPVLFLHFVFVFLRELEKEKLKLISVYFIGLGFQVLNFFTPWFIVGTSYRDFYCYPTPGVTYLGFFLFFVICAFYGLIKLFEAYTQAKGIAKNQLRYLLIGSVIGYIGGMDNFLITADIRIFPLYPYGAYAIAFYVFLTTYAIVTTRLMDIEVVIKRTAVYAALTLILTIAFLTATIFSESIFSRYTGLNPLWILTPSIIIIALFFDPLRRQIQDYVDRTFFKTRYEYQTVLKRYSHALRRPTTELDRLVKLSPYLVTKAMKLSGASVLILNRDLKQYEVRGGEKEGEEILGYFLDEENVVIKWLKKEKKTLLKDEVEDPRIKEELTKLKSTLLIPSISESEYFKEPTLLSIFALGEKIGGEAFSAEDIAFLETMANQASITIEYAFILEELKRDREKLIQSEKLAALGTMAAGVAHEIKNPLAALKLFAEMIPEKFESPEYRRKFISIIPSELSRLRSITADLESFSKPIEAKIESCSVNNIVDKTLRLLEVQFKKHNISVERQFNAVSNVSGNPQKLMQVFMNLILNAVQAMAEGGKLIVKTHQIGDKVAIETTDTGIGIPSDKLKAIFDPFYSTKEMGTGLGLAITHKIVEEHKGLIDVKSEVGKGSTFTVYLPI